MTPIGPQIKTQITVDMDIEHSPPECHFLHHHSWYQNCQTIVPMIQFPLIIYMEWYQHMPETVKSIDIYIYLYDPNLKGC